MSYQVLARKWRPKAFNEMVGQSHVLTVLSNALSLGRVHHAYLFSGTRGVGKTSIARLLAKGLNCEQGITANPCGECDNCRDIEQGRFVDLLEIDAASRTKVEDTREILDNIQYLPSKGRFKVYLIDEVHMLSRSSFNALLKTLEEPPAHVKFLLATTDPQKLPVTILSRCLHLHLNSLDTDLIVKQLQKILQVEQIDSDAKGIALLAKAANGSMRDALSLTDQAIALGNGKIDSQSVITMLGTLDNAIAFNLVEALHQNDGNALMEHVAAAAKLGIDWDLLLSETIALLHQIAVLQVVPSMLGDYIDYESRIKSLADLMSPNDVQLIYQILLMGRKEIAYAPDKKIGVEMSLLRALAFIPKGEVNNYELARTTESSSKVTTKTKQPQSPQQSSPSPAVTAQTIVPSSSEPAQSFVSTTASTAVSTTEAMPVSESNDTVDLQHVSVATQSILAARQQLIDSEKKLKKSEKVEGNQPNIDQTSTEATNDSADAAIDSNETSPKNAAGSALLQRLAKQPANQQHAQQPIQPQIGPTTHTATIATTIASTDAAGVDISGNDNDDNETAETYQWQFSEHFTPATDNGLNAKDMRLALEHEKPPELIEKLIEEAVKVDQWSAQVEQLQIPPLIKQLAVNAFLEELDDQHVRLHLRSSVAHLGNAANNIQKLAQALSLVREQAITINVCIDDNRDYLTPLEIREKIYQDKLQQAKQHVNQDEKIAMLCQLFAAKIDETSIRPI